MKRFIHAGFTTLTILVLLFTTVSTSPRAVSAQDENSDKYSILLLTGVIDTRNAEQAEPAAAGNLGGLLEGQSAQGAVEQPGYFIVQFSDIIQQAWRDSLVATGAEIFGYIPNNAYLVRMTEAVRAQVAALPNVQWIGTYRPAYRVSPDLAAPMQAQTTSQLTVTTFPKAGLDSIAAQVESAGGTVLSKSENEWQGVLKVEGPADLSGKLAGINGVMWVEPTHEMKLDNSVARGIMDVEDTVWGVKGLYGYGQIVGVADTGLDAGTTGAAMNDDFEGRIVAGIARGRAGDWTDTNGHGTHVAGSVLGNGRMSGSNPAGHSYANSHAGLAPEASLVFQSIMDPGGDLGGLPPDLNDLFLEAYNAGARIHTNSWGAPVDGQYTLDSVQVDQFMWSHPDFTILFSAGNDGADTNPADGVVDNYSIGSPGTAKNVVTVGASENNRTSMGFQATWYQFRTGLFFTSPIRDDMVSNNANGLAAFSSRGPTLDGRIKPDVVAPGTNILSVRSSKMDPAQNGWGALPTSDPYYGKYIFMGGTSMSTPLTAGGTALIREYYTDRGETPSAALVKATLINGAVDMTPGQYGGGTTQEIDTLPNNAEGFGRVNIQSSLFPAAPTQVQHVDIPNASGLNTGNINTYTYDVTNTSVPFRVTMAYTDYPALQNASKTLVNNLDLEVRTPNGKVIYPNKNQGPDFTNNVEDIFIAPGDVMVGTYTVTVRAYNVPQGQQGYGLVVRGGIGTISPTCPILWTMRAPSIAGSISVQTAPNCNGVQYNPGTMVTVQANPSLNYKFSSWSGAVESTSNPVTFAITSNATLTAHYIYTGPQITGLPMISRDSDPANGTFEFGATNWMISSPHGRQLIYPPGTGFPVAKHGGIGAAWLGAVNSDTSTIQTTVKVTSQTPFLSWYYWINSGDICTATSAYDFANVYTDGKLFGRYFLCDTYNTNGWRKTVIDLSPYIGKSITLQFEVKTDGSLYSNFYLDDILFQTTSTAEAAPDQFIPGSVLVPEAPPKK